MSAIFSTPVSSEPAGRKYGPFNIKMDMTNTLRWIVEHYLADTDRQPEADTQPSSKSDDAAKRFFALVAEATVRCLLKWRTWDVLDAAAYAWEDTLKRTEAAGERDLYPPLEEANEYSSCVMCVAIFTDDIAKMTEFEMATWLAENTVSPSSPYDQRIKAQVISELLNPPKRRTARSAP